MTNTGASATRPPRNTSASTAAACASQTLRCTPTTSTTRHTSLPPAWDPVVVSVPKKKKEAEAFKASWPTMKFRNPRFIVKDDRVRIASVTLETSYGKSYPYSMENLATYRCPDVAVDFRSIIDRSKALEGNTAQGVPSVRQNSAVVRAKSSVDENIPVTKRVNEHTIAVVWANENYDGDVERVCGAINDGETFARYLNSTFGIPQDKVRLVTDATAGQMKRLAEMAAGTETAWNYPQENHGTFTYFLLRKLQESKGNATLGELADYVRDNVEKTNMRLRSVRQSPNVNPSPSYDGDWRSLRLAK